MQAGLHPAVDLGQGGGGRELVGLAASVRQPELQPVATSTAQSPALQFLPGHRGPGGRGQLGLLLLLGQQGPLPLRPPLARLSPLRVVLLLPVLPVLQHITQVFTQQPGGRNNANMCNINVGTCSIAAWTAALARAASSLSALRLSAASFTSRSSAARFCSSNACNVSFKLALVSISQSNNPMNLILTGAHLARLPAPLLLGFLLLLLLSLPLQPALFHQLLGPLHPRLQLLPC